jgi:hypothetical protein
MQTDRREPTIATVATEFHCAVGSYFVFRILQKAKSLNFEFANERKALRSTATTDESTIRFPIRIPTHKGCKSLQICNIGKQLLREEESRVEWMNAAGS